MLEKLHLYDDTKARSAAMQMAIDEALLESARVPSLRFYRWRRPSLSFGYFGRFGDVVEHAAEREIVRRWTGGGIVFHGSDLTYSLVLPQNEAAAFRSSRAVYAEVHDAIRRALTGQLNATLARAVAPKNSDACFANPVEADVMAGGRKIAGAAQRRTRGGLLHQGSIQLEDLPAGLANEFAANLCAVFQRRAFTAELLQRARELARGRYAAEEWLRRRE